MNYSCIIVDDEYPARVLLNDFASRIPNLEVQATFRNPIEAISFLQENNTDILFTDVQMPGISGIDLLRSLPNPPKTILTTAYSEYALESYELSVVDYLLKPFRFERFLVAVNKAIHALSLEHKTSATGEILKVKADQKIHLVNPASILYIEGFKEYVRIHLEGQKLITLESLKNLEETLPDYFMRIHKSFIINLRFLKAVSAHEVQVNGITLPVGKTYRDMIKSRLMG